MTKRAAVQSIFTVKLEAAMLPFAFVLLALGICEAVKLPIYPDEVAFRIYLERFLADGWARQSLTPFCSNFRAAVPWPLLPAATAWSGLHRLGLNWLSFRLVPMVALSTVAAALATNGLKQGDHGIWRSVLLLMLGPSLYGFVILRPETLLLCASIIIFLLARRLATETRLGLGATFAAVEIFVFSLSVYVHPKAIYLAPLIMISLTYFSLLRSDFWSRICFMLVSNGIIVMVACAAVKLTQSQIMSCPAVPSFQSYMASQSVNMLDLFGDPGRFISQLADALGPTLNALTLSRLQFQPQYQVGYLPSIGVSSAGRIANVLVLTACVGSFAYIVLKTLRLLREAGSAHRREALLLLFLSLALLSPAVVNLTRNWYEAVWLVGTLAVLTGLLRPVARRPLSRSLMCVNFVFGLIIVCAASLSLYVMSKEITPSLVGYSGPGIPVGVDIQRSATTVHQLEREHGLTNQQSIIVDDLTYGPLSDHSIVAPVTYLGFALDRPEVLIASLKRFGFEAAITRCRFVTRLALIGWVTREQLFDPESGEQICLSAPNQ